MRLFLVLLLLLTSLSRAAEDTFRHALSAYKAGEIQSALTEFKKIAEDEKQISAALCHNIGNCEYKLGQAADGEKQDQIKAAQAHYGQASIWYRRALALDPWLPEAQQNLRFLEGKLGSHWFESYGTFASSVARIPRSLWRTVCFISIWVAVITIVWLAWATPRPGRRWPLVTLLCISVVSSINGGIGLWRKLHEPAPFARRIISIVSPESSARTAPAEAAGTVIPLKPGSELLPIREEGFWTYVEIPGSEPGKPLRGWVRTSTTEKLWPWSPSLVE